MCVYVCEWVLTKSVAVSVLLLDVEQVSVGVVMGSRCEIEMECERRGEGGGWWACARES